MSSFSRTKTEADSTATPKLAVDPAAARAAELLRKSRDGDRAAYGQLVVLLQDRLFNAVLRLVGDRDESAELTQEAFMRGFAALNNFRGESGAYTWLFRIAVNLSISRLRKVHRHRVFSLDRPSTGNGRKPQDQASGLVLRMQSGTQSPSGKLEQTERAEQVVAALGRIDPEYRAVLLMRDVEGFDYQQMADVLGVPLGTLKSRLFRARIALRDELKAYMSK
jgi:RNA polymerase sigma-70 factor (ECF subfamily)